MVYSLGVIHCSFCGGYVSPLTTSFGTENVCTTEACNIKATEYYKEYDKLLKDFADEKERLMRPLKEELDTNKFLLRRKYGLG